MLFPTAYKAHNRFVSFLLFCLALAVLSLCTGCKDFARKAGEAIERGIATGVETAAESLEGIAADSLETTEEIAAQTLESFDIAIATLDQNSAEWQNVLLQLERELHEEIRSTIRTEVSNLLENSVAATGQEFRCNTDFVGRRVKERLMQIRAEILKQPIPAFSPVFCSPVPPIVEYELVQSNRQTVVKIYGYNFEDISPLRLVLENAEQSVDVTRNVDYPSSYVITINLGSNGVPLTPQSDRMIFYWQDREIHTIGVIQPKAPPAPPIPEQVSVHQRNASAVSEARAFCPSDSKLVGGGYQVGHFDRPNVSMPVGDSWLVSGKTAMQSPASVNSVALCAKNLPGSVRIEFRKVNIEQSGSVHTECRNNEVLLAGGHEYRGGNPYPLASYPYRNGWTVEYSGAAETKSLTVYAMCYSGSVDEARYETTTVAGIDAAAGTATCRSDFVNTGGGFEGGTNLFPVAQSSSRNGWTVRAQHATSGIDPFSGNSINAWDFKIYAVCVRFR